MLIFYAMSRGRAAEAERSKIPQVALSLEEQK
jgi:hypothetical protein